MIRDDRRRSVRLSSDEMIKYVIQSGRWCFDWIERPGKRFQDGPAETFRYIIVSKWEGNDENGLLVEQMRISDDDADALADILSSRGELFAVKAE
jgi:hypothetical protein